MKWKLPHLHRRGWQRLWLALAVVASLIMPPWIVGVPMRAQDAIELNPALAFPPGNLDAHDLYAR